MTLLEDYDSLEITLRAGLGEPPHPHGRAWN